jgi:hypothetical protein
MKKQQERIGIRLTTDEKNEWQAKAAELGLSLSAYVKLAVRGQKSMAHLNGTTMGDLDASG